MRSPYCLPVSLSVFVSPHIFFSFVRPPLLCVSLLTFPFSVKLCHIKGKKAIISYHNLLFTIVLQLYIVTDLINTLPGVSSVNTVQQATIEEAVFSVDPTRQYTGWIVIMWYVFTVDACPFRSYISKSNRICSRQLRVTSSSCGRSTQTGG
jgi:hypothetical protein